MADDLDELGRRLDRIEHALRRPPDGPSRAPAGPEIRSARSIVNRVDDVWVAVTEGNDRLVTAVEGLRAELSRLAAALLPTEPPEDESGQLDDESVALGERLDRIEKLPAGPPAATADTLAEVARLLAAYQTAGEALNGRLGRMEETLAALVTPDDAAEALDGRLGRMEEALARVAAEDEPDPAVHLRLNRVEEALAGIAGRLEELAAATKTAAQAGADDANGNGVQAAVDALGREVRGMAGRVEGLAQGLEAPAVRGNDGTLVDRVGRLRDQFRR